MHANTFMLSGISEENYPRIAQSLSAIDGAKPIRKDSQTGLHIFVCISAQPPETIAVNVASAITGTGASIF